MKYVRIVKNTFIKGIPAVKGDEFEVDDRTAVLLGTKAVEIDRPGGKKVVEENSGVMESLRVVRQQETVVRPVAKNKPPESENPPVTDTAAPDTAEEHEEKPTFKPRSRGKGGKRR